MAEGMLNDNNSLNNLEIYKALMDQLKHCHTRSINNFQMYFRANILLFGGISGIAVLIVNKILSPEFSFSFSHCLFFSFLLIFIYFLSLLGISLSISSSRGTRRIGVESDFRVDQLRDIEYNLENSLLVSPFREGFYFMKKESFMIVKRRRNPELLPSKLDPPKQRFANILNGLDKERWDFILINNTFKKIFTGFSIIIIVLIPMIFYYYLIMFVNDISDFIVLLFVLLYLIFIIVMFKILIKYSQDSQP